VLLLKNATMCVWLSAACVFIGDIVAESIDREMIYFAAKTVAVIGAFSISIFGINRIFRNLADRQRSLGPQSLRAIGVVVFVPTLIVLTMLTDFGGATLAALLGTVAGYILSDSTEAKQSKSSGASESKAKPVSSLPN
jgi:hypothetical protein